MQPASSAVSEPPQSPTSMAEPPRASELLADPPTGTQTAMPADLIPFYPPECVAMFTGFAAIATSSTPHSQAASATAGTATADAAPHATARTTGIGWFIAATASSQATLVALGRLTINALTTVGAAFGGLTVLDATSRVHGEAPLNGNAQLFAPTTGVADARVNAAGTLGATSHPQAEARSGAIGTLSATSVLFTPSKMVKNGMFKSSVAAWTQIPNWTPQPGSTVTNHGVVVNGGKSNAVLTANIPWSGQVGFGATMQIRIKVDGAVVVTTTPIGTSPLTATVNHNVSNGSVVTVEISSNSGDLFQPEVAAGANTYLSIT